MKNICLNADCGKVEWVRGYCPKHYYALLHSGELKRQRRKVIRTAEEIFHASYLVNEETGCWEWTAWFHKKGYAYIQTHEQKKIRANRFAYRLYHGELLDSEKVLHTCDNRKCVCPDHLWKGSSKDNNQDCSSKGRHWMLTATKIRKVTKPMALNVRIIFARGEHSMQNLADIYLLDQQTISNIVCGRMHLRVD